MRIYLITCFLFSIITNGFCASDTTQTKTKKNIFSITLGAGKTVPKLTTDYKYESTSGDFYCIGLTYERKLKYNFSFLTEIFANNSWPQEILILENSDQYQFGDFLIINLNGNISLGLHLGAKFDLKLKNKERNLFSTAFLLGASRTEFGYRKIQQSSPGLGIPDYYYDYSENQNYLYFKGAISRKVRLSTKFAFTPILATHIMLTNIKEPEILISSSYYKPIRAYYKNYSYFIGLQFDF